MQNAETQGIGPFMATCLVVGTMIGSGIYLLPATLAGVGTISLLGWLLAACGAMLVGLTIALLARTSGGCTFFDAIGLHLGQVPALVGATLYLLGVVLAVTAVAVAVSGGIGFLFPSLAGPSASTAVTVGLIWLFAALNHSGARRVAQLGSAMLVVGLAPVILVGAGGWGHFDLATFQAGWNVTGRSDLSALSQATMLVFWGFLGLETASAASSQMRDPHRTVPIATVAGILVSALIYIAATTVVAGIIPHAELARSTAPFAQVAALILGNVAGLIVAGAGVAKGLGTLGGVQLSAIESWLAVQRQAGVQGLSRPRVILAIAAIASAVAIATASPQIAEQYGRIIGAVVTLSFLVFALLGISLVRAGRPAGRIVGALASIFCLGLLAAQPAATLMLAAGCLAVTLGPVLALALRRGWTFALPAG